MFTLTLFMPGLKALIFIKISQKVTVFLQKMQIFRALGALPPNPRNSPHIADFWPRACWEVFMYSYSVQSLIYTVLVWQWAALKHEDFIALQTSWFKLKLNEKEMA